LQFQIITDVEIQEFKAGVSNNYMEVGAGDFTPEALPYADTYEISRDNFQIGRYL
jgi:hypothetical protein